MYAIDHNGFILFLLGQVMYGNIFSNPLKMKHFRNQVKVGKFDLDHHFAFSTIFLKKHNFS